MYHHKSLKTEENTVMLSAKCLRYTVYDDTLDNWPCMNLTTGFPSFTVLT